MKKRILFVVILFIVFLGIYTFFISGKINAVKEIQIEKDEIEELQVNLEVDYGELNVSSGANDWINGTIDYNYRGLKPKVTYRTSNKKGTVTIEQPILSKIRNGKIKNTWDLELTNNIPIDLAVETGASDAGLNLRGMKLSNLDIETGVGRTIVDLSGAWEDSFTVDLEMGVGQTTVILPTEVGVQVLIDTGIAITSFNGFISEGDGVYVNDAFKNSDVTITVHAEIGVGEANFELKN